MNDKLSQQELELKQKLVSKQKEKNYKYQQNSIEELFGLS